MADRKIRVRIVMEGAPKAASAVKKVEKSTKSFTSAVKIANHEVRMLRNRKRRLAKEAKNLAQAQKKLTVSTKGMTNQFIKVNLASRGISKAIQLMTDSFKFGVSSGIEFEFTMKKISVISNIAGANLASLESTIKNIASQSPKTSSQVATAALEMSKMGLAGKDLENSLEGVVGLSVALDESVSTVGQTMLSVKNIFQKDATEMNDIADKLFTTLGNSALNLEKFSTAFSFAGASARLAGVSFEETAAVLGVLADNGIKASTIGTQFRQIMTRLDDPTSKISKLIGAQSLKTRGLSRTLTILNGVLKNSGDAKSYFGQRAIGVVDILTKNIGAVEKLTKKNVEMEKSTRKAAEALGQETMLGALKRVASAWELLFINVGNQSDGFWTKLASSTADGIKKFADSMDDVVQKHEFLDKFFREKKSSLGHSKEASLIKASKGGVRSHFYLEGEQAWDDFRAGLLKEQQKPLVVASAATELGKGIPELPAMQGPGETEFLAAQKRYQKEADDLAKAADKKLIDKINKAEALEKKKAKAAAKNLVRLEGEFAAEKKALSDHEKKIAEIKLKEKSATEAKKKAEGDKTLALDLASPMSKEIAEAREHEVEMLKLAGSDRDLRLQIHEDFLKKKKDITDKYANKELQTILANTQVILGGLSGFVGAMGNLSSIRTENAVKAAEAEGKSEEQIQAIRSKGFEEQKKFQIATTLMNTAAAVMQVWADHKGGGTFMKLAMAGLVGATGLAQVAAISSQKLATGFDGTVTQPTTFTVGEEGAEDVMVKPRSQRGKSSSEGGMVQVIVQGDINGEEQFLQRLNRGMEELDRRTV